MYRSKASIPPEPLYGSALSRLRCLRAGSVLPGYAVEVETRSPSSEAPRLMIPCSCLVVAGVLSVLVTAGYRQHANVGRRSNSEALIQLQLAEESYRKEHDGYLACSGSASIPAKGTFPYYFAPDHGCWSQLGVRSDPADRQVYAVITGPAGSLPPEIPGLAKQPQWPSETTGPWYVVEAASDADGNGIQEVTVVSSFPDVPAVIENPGE